MATLTERVITLSDRGMDFAEIAAILNISPEEVLEAQGGVSLATPAAGGNEPRWVAFDANLPNGGSSAIGIEASLPVFPADLWESAPYMYGTVDSSPIIAVPPGAVAIKFNNIVLQQGRGGDTVAPVPKGVLIQAAVANPHWCRFKLASPALTVAEFQHIFADGDLTISSQDAAEFSVVGHGLATATGGNFACTVLFEASAELDG